MPKKQNLFISFDWKSNQGSEVIKMSEELEVIITTQTFAEAGGTEAFPNLQMKGIVIGDVKHQGDLSYLMGVLNFKLDDQAKANGYTHIFGVKYQFQDVKRPTSECVEHLAIGTGYGPKKD